MRDENSKMTLLGQKVITQSDINCPAITFSVRHTEAILSKLGEGESKVYGPRKKPFPMKVHKNRSTGRVVFTSVKKFFDTYDICPNVMVQLFQDEQQNFWMIPQKQKDLLTNEDPGTGDFLIQKQVIESELNGAEKVFIWLTDKPAQLRQFQGKDQVTILADNGKHYTFGVSVEVIPMQYSGVSSVTCLKWTRIEQFVNECSVNAGDQLYVWIDEQNRLRISITAPSGNTGPSVPGIKNFLTPGQSRVATEAGSSSQGGSVIKDNTKHGMRGGKGKGVAPVDIAASKGESPHSNLDNQNQRKGQGVSGLDVLASMAAEIDGDGSGNGGEKGNKASTEASPAGGKRKAEDDNPSLFPSALNSTNSSSIIGQFLSEQQAKQFNDMNSGRGGLHRPGFNFTDIAGNIKQWSPIGKPVDTTSRGSFSSNFNLPPLTLTAEQLQQVLARTNTQDGGDNMSSLLQSLMSVFGNELPVNKLMGQGLESAVAAATAQNKKMRPTFPDPPVNNPPDTADGEAAKIKGDNNTNVLYQQQIQTYQQLCEQIYMLNSRLFTTIRERHAILNQMKGGEFQSKYQQLMSIERDLDQIKTDLRSCYEDAHKFTQIDF